MKPKVDWPLKGGREGGREGGKVRRKEGGREGGINDVPRVVQAHVLEGGHVQGEGVITRHLLDGDFGLDGEGRR